MPKRKKFPRLPSGFGSIRYLGKGRTNPYAVHPPCTDRDDAGIYIKPKPICYVPDWYTGFAVLTAWHAGTYTPGFELDARKEIELGDLDAFCMRVLKNQAAPVKAGATFAEVFELFYDFKFGENAPKKLSESSKVASTTGFKNLQGLHRLPFASITLQQLQSAVNGIKMSGSTVNNAVGLIKQMYSYAVPRELCEKDLGRYVVRPAAPEKEHAKAFTDEELAILWQHKEDPVIRQVLIMCYSGFRVSAYKDLEVNLADLYFRGGVKTKAGKDRIVPIHSAIVPLVKAGGVYIKSPGIFRNRMDTTLSALNLTGFRPHGCRHTFSRLCESYGVNEADRKRMMGHTFGSDITNGVYGHRTVEELRHEIEKIRVP